jgi:hypothetical protein
LFSGFINVFERSTADAIGDIIIAPQEKIPDYQQLISQLEELKPVEAATPTLTAQGLLHLAKGNVRAVEIWGIDLQKEGRVTMFTKSLLKGKKTPDTRPQTQDHPIEGLRGILGPESVLEPGFGGCHRWNRRAGFVRSCRPDKSFHIPRSKFPIGHVPDVPSGTECITVSGDDNHFHMRIFPCLLKVLVPEGDHLMTKRIFRFWPVKGDDGDMVFDSIDDMGFVHFLPSL